MSVVQDERLSANKGMGILDTVRCLKTVYGGGEEPIIIDLGSKTPRSQVFLWLAY